MLTAAGTHLAQEPTVREHAVSIQLLNSVEIARFRLAA